jgi:hypothetical protein
MTGFFFSQLDQLNGVLISSVGPLILLQMVLLLVLLD